MQPKILPLKSITLQKLEEMEVRRRQAALPLTALLHVMPCDLCTQQAKMAEMGKTTQASTNTAVDATMAALAAASRREDMGR